MTTDKKLFEGFLSDANIYDKAIIYWKTVCGRILETAAQDGWKMDGPFKFVDGTVNRDGNPMIDLSNRQLGKAIRIIQFEGEPMGEATIWGYMDVRGEDDSMRELVLQCSLSERTSLVSSRLISAWIHPESTIQAMQDQIRLMCSS